MRENLGFNLIQASALARSTAALFIREFPDKFFHVHMKDVA
jgi:sugar phosphate isomerase/epimerase